MTSQVQDQIWGKNITWHSYYIDKVLMHTHAPALSNSQYRQQERGYYITWKFIPMQNKVIFIGSLCLTALLLDVIASVMCHQASRCPYGCSAWICPLWSCSFFLDCLLPIFLTAWKSNILKFSYVRSLRLLLNLFKKHVVSVPTV